MPSKRLIAVLVLSQGRVVQSIGFNRYLPVGRPEVAARFLSEWGADEIFLLDIDATRQGRTIDPEVVARTAASCFVPLGVAGGLKNLSEMQSLLDRGADKIVVNSALLGDRALLREAVNSLGTQCLVASIDVRSYEQGWQVFHKNGREPSAIALDQLVAQAIEDGFGEIMLNVIDRDGEKAGFDLPLANAVGKGLPVPLIMVGGAGHPQHIKEVLSLPYVSAAGVGNMLHFEEHSVAVIKSYLADAGLDIRLGSLANYQGRTLDNDGRLCKVTDDILDQSIFEYLPDERYDLL